jgi:hypothetical protein
MLSSSELEMECRGEKLAQAPRSWAGVTRTEGMRNGMEDLEVAIPFPTAAEADAGKERCRVGRRDGVLLRGLKVLVASLVDMVAMKVNDGTMTSR